MSVALKMPNHPEPVPGATQLAALPFLAAVEGYLRHDSDPDSLRLTLHRVMSRNGGGYLQQVCAYVGTVPHDPTKAGRIFAVSDGIMGHAYKTKMVVRTRRYDDEDAFLADLQSDIEKTGGRLSIADAGRSYLAVPLLFGDSEVVAVLYAEAKQFNLFGDNQRVQDIMAFCDGFCRTLDRLTPLSLGGIRNFRLEQGQPVVADETVYPTVQEPVDLGPVPRFETLRSFNFEATV